MAEDGQPGTEQDRVRLTNDDRRALIGVVGQDGALVRIHSPNLIKAMGRQGITEGDLVPQTRKGFELACKKQGLDLKQIVDRRWVSQENERRALVENLLNYRVRLIEKADELDEKIRQLTVMRDGLRHASACNAPSHMECPSFRRILRAATAGRIGPPASALPAK